MIIIRCVFPATAIFLALSLTTSAAIADQTCRQVQSNVTDISEVFVDPDPNCNGYDFCQYVDISGTLNGRWWAFWNAGDEELVAGNTAFAFNIDNIFETNQGEIYAEERGIINLFAPNGYAAHFAVAGGTDTYEGATGWMTGTLIFFPDTGGMLAGEICWNGD